MNKCMPRHNQTRSNPRCADREPLSMYFPRDAAKSIKRQGESEDEVRVPRQADHRGMILVRGRHEAVF
ncbi:hypothetical protein JMJ77_0003960 [Colletotrichum scovillei]|uniref:Uncharacterized protein n=1 Tax=Colletotrichum scovillei TaxID=1209932 RepID=A0A9P7QWI6_9PEZI|nr:hypothetical protein JMJ77_0003960 [Colletotrichum scovillei]KAG7049208.1 hypothetical protein JMJ78_0013191 [Colletotrichum scovillei]KAG7063950.1 hypothetical protein JMJ76_0006998 [Colletotrichum scovillei]